MIMKRNFGYLVFYKQGLGIELNSGEIGTNWINFEIGDKYYDKNERECTIDYINHDAEIVILGA